MSEYCENESNYESEVDVKMKAIMRVKMRNSEIGSQLAAALAEFVTAATSIELLNPILKMFVCKFPMK